MPVAARCHRGVGADTPLDWSLVPSQNPRAIDIRFRPMEDDDLERLHDWLREPHVRRWWNETLDLDGVRAKYRPRIAGLDATRMFIAGEGDSPLGWVQSYRWADYPEHAARLSAGPTEAGMDLAIGDPARVGRGIGPRIIEAFVRKFVFAEATNTACVVDPDVENHRSVRAFSKAGFVHVSTVRDDSDPSGPSQRAVMRLLNPAVESPS